MALSCSQLAAGTPAGHFRGSAKDADGLFVVRQRMPLKSSPIQMCMPASCDVCMLAVAEPLKDAFQHLPLWSRLAPSAEGPAGKLPSQASTGVLRVERGAWGLPLL